jgi:hypothetical protein
MFGQKLNFNLKMRLIDFSISKFFFHIIFRSVNKNKKFNAKQVCFTSVQKNYILPNFTTISSEPHSMQEFF